MQKRERQALAQFLKEELRMELSMEKTRITDVREGFDFLGYRVVQKKSPVNEATSRQTSSSRRASCNFCATRSGPR